MLKITAIGNLTNDVELKMNETTGKPYAILRIASDRRYKDNRGAFEAADGHTLLRYLEAAHFDAVTWEIVPGTTYERAILGKVDTTTPEYRAFREAICKDALGRMGLGHLLKTKEKEVKEVGHER